MASPLHHPPTLTPVLNSSFMKYGFPLTQVTLKLLNCHCFVSEGADPKTRADAAKKSHQGGKRTARLLLLKRNNDCIWVISLSKL